MNRDQLKAMLDVAIQDRMTELVRNLHNRFIDSPSLPNQIDNFKSQLDVLGQVYDIAQKAIAQV